MTLDPKTESKVREFVAEDLKALHRLLDYGLGGFGPLEGARELAQGYKKPGTSRAEQIRALAKGELKKHFAAGFLTSLGGLLTLPFVIPASMAASWVLQIRMVAAMADLGGFDLEEPQVRAAIAFCLLGKRGTDLVESDFHALQKRMVQGHFYSLSPKALLLINQGLLRRLAQMAGQKGLTRLGRLIPLAGGVLGGTIDYWQGKETADFAFELFGFDRPENQVHES